MLLYAVAMNRQISITARTVGDHIRQATRVANAGRKIEGADAIVTLRTDLLLLALPCFLTAIFVRSRLAVLGALLVAASALATQVPGASALIFVGASVVATIALPWALRDTAKKTE